MISPLEQVLQELSAHFARRGWHLSSRPTSVLAMQQQPSEGVEHTLFINAPWLANELTDAVGVACTVNVHFPSLEACINEALDRDPADAGRQSLRLSLARLVPPDHLLEGQAYAAGPGADSPGVQQLLSDFDACLEPVRQRLCTLQSLACEPLPPPSVDPWTWRLRRAAYLHLHADAALAEPFLIELQAQAECQLAEPDIGRRQPWVRRGAEEALALARALRQPRRRVIRLTPAA